MDEQIGRWNRFRKYFFSSPALGLTLDISRMRFGDGYFSELKPQFDKAFEEMDALEKGALANADEGRMVGHYWLRDSSLAPNAEIRSQIDITLRKIESFAADVHSGKLQGSGGPFTNLLIIGIGGSALGPQFLSHALGHPVTEKMTVYFFDNTDPDGMDRTLSRFITQLSTTLCVIISKSGGTKETRNGMLEVQKAFQSAGLRFPEHAVAITGEGSALDQYAQANDWIARFPMWDWVGGRTSVTSAVGLLPAALQGLDFKGILSGAKACDEVTRRSTASGNPAALLAAMWYFAGHGHGDKAMVVLPYKDRLELCAKYLQQLVMESLGKELDRGGNLVQQGLTVYGNKGSTDQHAYVQQLREGPDNFFVTFISVGLDRAEQSMFVEENTTTGDYLFGFQLGTREALTEKKRNSISIEIAELNSFSVGLLIALFERAVGLYASLINVNAYHQPGVEAGKVAADDVLDLVRKVIQHFKKSADGKGPQSAQELADILGFPGRTEAVFLVCRHLATNGRLTQHSGADPCESRFGSL